MTVHRIATIATLLVVCSTSAAAQPVAATLISPASDVNGTTIAFTWQSAPTATWYHFWLGKADTTLVTEHWYTAEHAGCASGGTCAITVTPPVTAGAYIWHIRTWSSAGYGPWSAPHMFTMRDVVQAWSGTLPASRRFTLVLAGEAVLDNETGLVWVRTPHSSTFSWPLAFAICGTMTNGGRRGWRMATLSELLSLTEPATIAPSLPPGHPFELGDLATAFWTTTPASQLAGGYFSVSIASGFIFQSSADLNRRLWCVRGGTTSH